LSDDDASAICDQSGTEKTRRRMWSVRDVFNIRRRRNQRRKSAAGRIFRWRFVGTLGGNEGAETKALCVPKGRCSEYATIGENFGRRCDDRIVQDWGEGQGTRGNHHLRMAKDRRIESTDSKDPQRESRRTNRSDQTDGQIDQTDESIRRTGESAKDRWTNEQPIDRSTGGLDDNVGCKKQRGGLPGRRPEEIGGEIGGYHEKSVDDRQDIRSSGYRIERISDREDIGSEGHRIGKKIVGSRQDRFIRRSENSSGLQEFVS